MSGKRREFHGSALGEVVVVLFSAKTELKIRRLDEEGGMVQGGQRNRWRK